MRSLAKEFGLGGVILFARNVAEPEQVAELAFEAARLVPELPVWVSIDQEGGRVARLKKPFTEWPPMAALGRSGDHWYGCADGGLPVGRRDVAAGRAAGDSYTAQLCASRRYLYDRLDALGRRAFAAAFSTCGIG